MSDYVMNREGKYGGQRPEEGFKEEM